MSPLKHPFGRGAERLRRPARSTREARYTSTETALTGLAKRRDYVAGKIKTALWRATFLNKPPKASLVRNWVTAGNKVLAEAAALRKGA